MKRLSPKFIVQDKNLINRSEGVTDQTAVSEIEKNYISRDKLFESTNTIYFCNTQIGERQKDLLQKIHSATKRDSFKIMTNLDGVLDFSKFSVLNQFTKLDSIQKVFIEFNKDIQKTQVYHGDFIWIRTYSADLLLIDKSKKADLWNHLKKLL